MNCQESDFLWESTTGDTREHCTTMWGLQQLCRRAAPACRRVGQQRRTMGFFDSIKKDFEKELDKNKEAKKLWESIGKKETAEPATKQSPGEGAKPAGEAPKQEQTAESSKPSIFEEMRKAAAEAMEAAKQSEAAKVAQEAAAEIKKNAGVGQANSSFSKTAEEVKKAAGESGFAKAAREAAEELAKQAKSSSAGQRMKAAQDEQAARKWQEEMDAKMTPEPKKKTYFADLNAEAAPEVPEEELDRETTGLVKVKRRSNAWEKQKARVRPIY